MIEHLSLYASYVVGQGVPKTSVEVCFTTQGCVIPDLFGFVDFFNESDNESDYDPHGRRREYTGEHKRCKMCRSTVSWRAWEKPSELSRGDFREVFRKTAYLTTHVHKDEVVRLTWLDTTKVLSMTQAKRFINKQFANRRKGTAYIDTFDGQSSNIDVWDYEETHQQLIDHTYVGLMSRQGFRARPYLRRSKE